MEERISLKESIATFQFQTTEFSLCLGRSRVDRYGVFAGEDIPRGKFVIEYGGARVTIQQANRRLKKYYREHGRVPKREYLFLVKDKTLVDGAIGGTGAEYINHSCDGNLRIKRAHGRIFLFSRRKIRAGEELNYDYAVSAEERKMRCHCGSPKCRGTINFAPKTKGTRSQRRPRRKDSIQGR